MEYKKNGFVFVETIVAIVVLTSSLLLLYSSFNKILQTEKTRVYYDDVTYIYRSQNIKKELDELNIMAVLNDITDTKKYFVTVGVEYKELFEGYEKEKAFFTNMLADFEVSQMILIKENKIDNLKNCTMECSIDSTCFEYENCNSIYTNLSDEFISYLKTIYVDVSTTYILAVEYNTCTGSNGNDNCKKYYSWVGV